jgi:hypothetical protein
MSKEYLVFCIRSARDLMEENQSEKRQKELHVDDTVQENCAFQFEETFLLLFIVTRTLRH